MTAIASAVYLVTLVVVPLLAPERDVLSSHPEHYADTTFGWLVRVGYVAVAVAALSIALAAWSERGRSRYAATALAVAGGLAALVLGVAPHEVTGGPMLLGIFGLALTPAATSIAWSARLMPLVRAFGIAVTLSFVALALGPADRAGLVNRIWDGLFALWGIALGSTATRAR